MKYSGLSGSPVASVINSFELRLEPLEWTLVRSQSINGLKSPFAMEGKISGLSLFAQERVGRRSLLQGCTLGNSPMHHHTSECPADTLPGRKVE